MSEIVRSGGGGKPRLRRLARLYAPLALVIFAQALFIAVAPSPPEELGFASTPALTPSTGPSGAGTNDSLAATEVLGVGPEQTGNLGTTLPGSGSGAGGAADTRHCVDGRQNGFSVYAPPCVPVFSGDNGGATAAGVSAEAITVVSFQNEFDPQVSAILGPVGLSDDPDVLTAFDEAAVAFLNDKYEFYGRRIELVRYESACSETTHDVDRCRASVGEVIRMHPFAVVWPINLYPELIDEFARAGIIALAGTGDPQERFVRARPYRYDPFMDGTRSAQVIADYYCKKLAGRPADRAGQVIHPTIGGRESVQRRLGIVVPGVEVSTLNADAVVKGVSRCGAAASIYRYDQDITRAVEQANALVAALIRDRVTTVVCLCDIIAPSFFTPTMTAQRYFPEHLLPGTGSLDSDAVARLYDGEQWIHAFGPGQLPAAHAPRDSDAQAVWATAGGRGDVCASCASIYWPYWSLLGFALQTAGPNLTPATFESGLVTAAPMGGWTATHRSDLPLLSFGPDDRTGVDDAREVWWDPGAISAGDGKRGAYALVAGGERWRVGEFPTTLDVPPASR